MVTVKTLLPELKKQVELLAEDLLARATGNAEIDAGLREAFTQIEKGGRTAQAYEVWREDYLDQVAVAWVLACVFVRFLEDNRLIDECWLASEGERRTLAEDTHELFFRQHPHDTEREYFQHVFHEVGKIPAASELFAEGKTPLWAVGPSGDAAMKLLAFWREIDAEAGHLKRSFEVEGGDTRFLGDLYQDLSERARKKYALLQTPVFVEEFILDRTLDPAIEEFGLDTVRMIDPTCGSGHFLLGGFARLFNRWMQRENNEIVAAQKALDGVWGVDINPFAVAIARFRLIVAAAQACGIKRLKEAPGWNIHLATGDSLLFGGRWNRTGERAPEQDWFATSEGSWAPEIYACEDREALQEVLGQQYHAVVGNPPYITVKDKALSEAYRQRFTTCHRQYSLGVPFTERFYDLAAAGEDGRSGYMGMITTNSFMKREFGKKLIEEFLSRVDLSHIVDTSGAFIPAHNTPTVILFGRNRKPQGNTIRAVLGIKGEPSTPSDPAKGFVWLSISEQIDKASSEDEYTSSLDVARAGFAKHPWSIGGGGVSDVQDQIETASGAKLGERATCVGRVAHTGNDEPYVAPRMSLLRRGIQELNIADFVEGETIRDWVLSAPTSVLFPYDGHLKPLKEDMSEAVFRWLWPYRDQLWNRREPNGTHREIGKTWYEFSRFHPERFVGPCITMAFVATHNHFVLDRGGKVFNRSAPIIKLIDGDTELQRQGGKVFKQSAPIIKLTADASEVDHLGLLGVLNSSIACFWMKQIFYPKSTASKDIDTERGKPESNRYEFAATGLLSFPLPQEDQLRGSLVVEITDQLENLASSSSSLMPRAVLEKAYSDNKLHHIDDLLREAGEAYSFAKRRMIALQEELDWEVYRIYSLTNTGASETILGDQLQGIDAGQRPYLWGGEEPPLDIPSAWRETYEIRRQLVSSDTNIGMIETPVFKRPWWGRQGVYGQASRTYSEWVNEACQEWLLDRLEDVRYWSDTDSEAALQTTAKLADKASGDKEFLGIASLYRGRPDFDVAALVNELIEGESVPFLPILRYKPSGIRKREVWEHTWDLQRKQDAGKDVGDIPVPPKYATADFLKQEYWRHRGKLDVPKERWISYPHIQTESDPSLVVGWTGWDHLQQASALVAYYDARKREGWDARRLTPILAGLDQLLPWIHQWHPEIDPEFGDTAGQSYQALLEHDAHELGLTLDDIRSWQPPEKPRKARSPRKTKAPAEADE